MKISSINLRTIELYYINSLFFYSYVAATQAEPTYTRLILPCYDEPAFKSNFTISLTHSSSLKSVSNMPVEKIEILG